MTLRGCLARLRLARLKAHSFRRLIVTLRECLARLRQLGSDRSRLCVRSFGSPTQPRPRTSLALRNVRSLSLLCYPGLGPGKHSETGGTTNRPSSRVGPTPPSGVSVFLELLVATSRSFPALIPLGPGNAASVRRSRFPKRSGGHGRTARRP